MFTLHRKSKNVQTWVMWLTILALASYVLVSFGSAPATAPKDTIVSIGKTKIKMRDAFIQSQRLSNMFGSQIQDDMLNNLTANQLMSEAVLIDGAERIGMAVSDDELRDYVINQRTMPSGEFVDEENWSNYVRRSFRLSVDSFEEYIRDNSLRSTKFRNLFNDSAYVSEKEVIDAFVANNRKVKLEMVTINSNEVTEQAKLKDEAAVKKFFEDNSDEFLSGDRRNVDYVSVDIRALEADVEITDEKLQEAYNQRVNAYTIPESVQVREIQVKGEGRSNDEAYQLTNKVYDEISNGMAFEVAQKEYHEGTRAGMITVRRGSRAAEIDQALFEGMADDEVSPPLKTDTGFSIFQRVSYTEGRTRTLDEVRRALENNIRRTESQQLGRTKLEAFQATMGEGKSFADAAAEHGFEVKTSPFFDNAPISNMGEDLQKLGVIRSAVFNLAQKGDVTAILSSSFQQFICMYKEDAEPAPLSWDTDKDRITATATTLAEDLFIRNTLEAIQKAAEADPEKPLKELKGNRDWLKDDSFTETREAVNASLVPAPLSQMDLDFEGDLYSLEVGQFLGRIETNMPGSFVLARVTDKEEPDMTLFDEEKVAITQRLRSEGGNLLLQTFIFSQQQKFDPKQERRARLLSQLSRRQFQ